MDALGFIFEHSKFSSRWATLTLLNLPRMNSQMNKKRQAGNSGLVWLLVFGIGGMILLCTIKMAPVYIDDMFVKGSLTFLVDNNADLQKLDKSEIRSQLGKYYTINSVPGVSEKDYKIRDYKGRLLIDMVYEKRVNIIHNVDAVMSFKHQLDLDNPDQCCKYVIEDFDEKK